MALTDMGMDGGPHRPSKWLERLHLVAEVRGWRIRLHTVDDPDLPKLTHPVGGKETQPIKLDRITVSSRQREKDDQPAQVAKVELADHDGDVDRAARALCEFLGIAGVMPA